MRIVVTGGDGFIGRNLRVRLAELGYTFVENVERGVSDHMLRAAIAEADYVFHLAGVNRPQDPADFDTVNRGFTATVCDALRRTGRPIPVALTSSTQALLNNPYGASKRAAEAEIGQYAADTGALAYVFRLTNVFGKWCRPNYNSVVATFCHNSTRGLPIAITDPAAPLRLVYIDDVVSAMCALLIEPRPSSGDVEVQPVYTTTVGEVAAAVRTFVDSRDSGVIPPVGNGLMRALYATYMSYLEPDAFTYPLVSHTDPRGVFAEVIKTGDSGQVSFFTALPGVTRGGHYHHTKTEKFLVLRGHARFRFRHIITGELREIVVSGDESRIVETVPGWAHDVTNLGTEELIVMLWANEVFNPAKPDTITASIFA